MPDDDARPDYFAVPDPLDPDKLSYWYRSKRGRQAGRLQPWPPRRNRWGVLYRSTLQEVPENQRTQYQVDWWRKVREARAQVAQAIDTDPALAAARWAAAQSACCYCGKVLTDERSKAYGVGPDCREGMGPEVLKELVAMMQAAHAEGRLSWRGNSRDDPELFATTKE